MEIVKAVCLMVLALGVMPFAVRKNLEWHDEGKPMYGFIAEIILAFITLMLYEFF